MPTEVVKYRIRQLFATLTATETSNPTLLEGELWHEKHATTGQATGRTKTGDGVTAFTSLPFDPGGGGGGGSGDVVGPASSVDGRAALFDGTTGKLLKQAGAAPVLEGDARLSDARTPTAHNQAASTISDSTTAGRALLTAADATAQRSALGLGTAATTAATDYAPVAHVGSGGTAHSNAVAAGAAGFMTGADKTKLDGIAAGAEVNVNADWNAGSGDAQILNKPTLGSAAAAATGDFAPAAQGVTNGNSHNHDGGDGAQIAYSSLSGLPTLATGTNTGDQTIANSSDATSHTVTLSASGGTLQIAEGSNITLTTTGTSSAGVVTIAATGGGATNLSYTAATRVIASDTGTDATLPLVTSGDAGLAPASGGGTSNYLRADGTWAAPSGSGYANDNYAIPANVLIPQATDARPKNWSGANPTAKFLWQPAASGSGAVTWGIAITALNENDVVDVAPTWTTVNDAVVTAQRDQLTAATSAISIQGTVTADSRLQYWIRRDPTDGSDTMSQDARLVAVVLTFALT
jgi:hypothetical protein